MASDERRRIIEEASRILVEVELGKRGAQGALHAWIQRHSTHVVELLEQAGVKCRLKQVTAREWAEALHRADPRKGAATERGAPAASNNIVPLHANISWRSVTPASPHLEWWRAALVASSILVCALGALLLVGTHSNVYSTGPGEMRRVRLIDGSLLKLNSDSAVHMRYASGARDVELLNGEALFTVAHDARRPFRVTSENSVVQAIGTEFDVQRTKEGELKVLVTRGRIALFQTSPSRLSTPRVTASAGDTLSYRPRAGMSAVSIRATTTREKAELLDWTTGRITFNGTSVQEVVERFNRYNATQIVLDDPTIGQHTLGGQYRIDDPHGFAQSLAIFDVAVRVDPTTGTLHLFRQAQRVRAPDAAPLRESVALGGRSRGST
ncbi:MAG TPA: FecR domain-containing protein [Polyangiaceae bacterium]|nr:FecR domain-containing protein [Polyangiaceae bacterium]